MSTKFYLAVILMWVVCGAAIQAPLIAQPKRFVLPRALSEASGLTYVGPDSLWWINDSGNAAELFRTDYRGQLLETLPLPAARNVDWEDLTTDGKGTLYIGDFGNNANRRKDLKIYMLDMENRRLDSLLFNYPDQDAFPPPPDQANFDMEGFFFYEDSLHLFSKNRLRAGNYMTKHYTLPAAPGVYTAILKDSLLLPKRVVTAAALSADKQEVALLSYFYNRILGFIPKTRTTIFYFTEFSGSAFLKGQMRKQRVPHCSLPSQYEALDYAPDGTLIVGSEKTPLFRAQARRMVPRTRRKSNTTAHYYTLGFNQSI